MLFGFAFRCISEFLKFSKIVAVDAKTFWPTHKSRCFCVNIYVAIARFLVAIVYTNCFTLLFFSPFKSIRMCTLLLFLLVFPFILNFNDSIYFILTISRFVLCVCVSWVQRQTFKHTNSIFFLRWICDSSKLNFDKFSSCFPFFGIVQ